MNQNILTAANYIKARRQDYTEGNINYFCWTYKRDYPDFDENLFRRYIDGQCGPKGRKIKKPRPKHMIYDGLDLSEMMEGE